MTRRLALAALLALAACGTTADPAATPAIETVAASRQRIVVDVEATGVITPINAIDVRSKASGQITTLDVQTGDRVTAGQLLVRIDPRTPRSNFDQASAAVRAATEQVAVTKAQFERNRALLAQGVLTAPEFETARTGYASAQSQLVAARSQLEIARIALEDVTIRAPSPGTVIARNVAAGQVISSSTNSPSGGTILLTLADLSVVHDSTLVNESDIGKVRPGMAATVTADAYPGRTFRGTVEKVEPRATIVQSVTFFPVVVRLDNAEGLLMPGMNTDVSILVDERDGVLAVPVDAVRTTREAASAATALGLDPEQVRARLQAARTASGGGNGGGAGEGNAAGGTGGDAARAGRAGRGGDVGADRPAAREVGSGVRAPRAQRGVVFVATGATYEPRLVTLGTSNYDVTEITDGLREGEKVALVSAAALQQQRQERNERLRSRTALPGMGGGSGGGSGGGARGGGGGSAGGGGGGGGGGNRGG